jgi:prepilin-type processing-associated H-X9-DG protein/prepilin-type N-terminal cleavage/methylation domain-containing protein
MRREASYFQNSAFTLIELLVVIANIGALAALLLPTLGKAKGKTNQVVCLSNMRQLGLAISMYAGDYRNVLPHSDDKSPLDGSTEQAGCWFYAVDPYLLNTISSNAPSAAQRVAALKQDPMWKTLDSDLRPKSRTIKMNRKLIGKNRHWSPNQQQTKDADPPYRTTYTIPKMANTVLLFDGRTEDTSSPGDKQRYDGWEVYVTRRHSDGANVLFVDGHGEWRKEKQQTAGNKTGWEPDKTTLDWWVE